MPRVARRPTLPRISAVAAGGGAVVNVSSAVAVNGGSGFTAYTATKGAMNALSRSLAKEHA